MGTEVLVAYATKHGSTREVAAEIAQVIEAMSGPVRLCAARDVEDVAGYGLVVVGAPLYAGKWHKDALRLLKRQHAALATVPVAVFALGPRSPREEGTWPRCREQLDRALMKVDWLHPIAVELFGGVDPPGKKERRDQREWTAIRAWAAKLAPAAD